MHKSFSGLLVITVLYTYSAFAQLSGPLSGTIITGTYTITGDIFVISGDSLKIEAGTEFIFNEGIGFDISGHLHAAGTITDSIKFINSPALTWAGIDFNYCYWDSSRLEYCLITGGQALGSFQENCGGGICCWSSSPAIFNCTISGNSADYGGGIYCSDNSCPTISDCAISDNSVSASGGGIYCDESSPTISKCTINGNSASDLYCGGIYCYNNSSPIIENCTISDNSANFNGGGIHCYWSSPTISNCTISGNSAGNGNGGGIFCYYNSSPAIFNCTISGNSADYGGGIYCYYSTPFLVNTIVEGNAGNGGVYFYSSSDASLTYNNFDNNEGGNFTGSPPAHLGQNVTVNANGDSCDIYYNIFEEPLFADPNAGNFNLLADSPCIDAGNPAFPCDPDSTIADVGAFYFDQGAGIPAVEDLAVSIVGDSVILQWTEMTDAQYYKIYRSEVPLFDISSMTAIGLVFEAVYEEENVINGGPWFYVVTVEY